MSLKSQSKQKLKEEQNSSDVPEGNIANTPIPTNKTCSRIGNNKSTTILHPRIKELLSDKVFQYFFSSNFNSKEYNEFNTLSEGEKLNFMIDLYFFIMIDVNMDTILDLKNLNREEQIENINGEIRDRLLILKDDISRNNIINSMRKYNINNTINEQSLLTNKFHEILEKYKMDKWEQSDFGIIEINNNNNQYNDKPISMQELQYPKDDNSTIIQNKTMTYYAKPTTSSFINQCDNTSMRSINKVSRLKSYVKLDIGKVNSFKMGSIKKGKFYSIGEMDKEILYTPEKSVFISKHNGIQENSQTHYVINSKFKKFKHPNSSQFVTPLSYKTLSNPKKVSVIKSNKLFNMDNIQLKGKKGKKKDTQCFIISDSMISEELFTKMHQNDLILVKSKENKEMNELINKIYSYDDNEVILNKNEINKIGILLIEYVELEKKYNILLKSKKVQNENSDNVNVNEKVDKIKNVINSYSSNVEKRIKESKKFIEEYQTPN